MCMSQYLVHIVKGIIGIPFAKIYPFLDTSKGIQHFFTLRP